MYSQALRSVGLEDFVSRFTRGSSPGENPNKLTVLRNAGWVGGRLGVWWMSVCGKVDDLIKVQVRKNTCQKMFRKVHRQGQDFPGGD